MIIPTKHEDLSNSLLAVGHTVLKKLKRRPFVIEDLFEEVGKYHNVGLAIFMDVLTFLWCCDLIETNDYEIRLTMRSN